jgi:hypothetical protein
MVLPVRKIYFYLALPKCPIKKLPPAREQLEETGWSCVAEEAQNVASYLAAH